MPVVERNPDWRLALMQFLSESMRRPLVFGQHDCALFAAGAVQAMTRQDFAAAYRGRYDSLKSGLKLLARDGFADHVALARARLPSIAVAEAMPGDLAVLAADPLPALGVVQGPAIYVLSVQGVIGLMPLTDAVQAFRV